MKRNPHALLAAKNARIQMLLRMLAESEAEKRRIAQERDTYSEGLHMLRDEMFQARMQVIVTTATPNPNVSNPGE